MKHRRTLVLRQEGRVMRWVDQDTDEVVYWVEIPEDGITMADVERFRARLLRLIEQDEPS